MRTVLGRLSVAIVLGVGIALLTGPRSAAEEAAADPVRVGVVTSLFQGVPSYLIPSVLRPIQTMMETQTGMAGKVSPVAGWEQLAHELDTGKTQIGLFHGFEFAWAKQKCPRLEPVIVTVGRQGLTQSLVIVRSDSTASKFEDLRGTHVVVPRKTRETCRLFLTRSCADCDSTPERFFASQNAARYTEEGFAAVCNGKAHAILADGATFEDYLKSRPDRVSQLKVLIRSEPFPPAVFVCRQGAFDEKTLERFRSGMLEAHKTAQGKDIMSLCQILRFERVPEDYTKTLEDSCKTYPVPVPASK